MKIFYILIAIVMLGFIITIHEFGHYIVGRLCGIGIREFSVGFGPRLFGFERKGIRYSVRVILLGGYCSFVGEDESNSDPRAMNNQPVWKRFLTVLAGPAMNVVLAYVFCAVYLCSFVTAEYYPKVVSIEQDMPAAQSGLEIGDTITAINGTEITYDTEGVALLHTVLNEADLSQPLELTIDRDGTAQDISITPVLVIDENSQQKTYQIGISLGGRNYSLWESVTSSGRFLVSFTGQMLSSLKNLIFKGEGADDLMGTVGIISLVSDQVRDEKLEAVIYLIFILSLDIGIMNLLPIPALDGGRLLFLIIEAVRRKPIPPEKEGTVHLIGFVLLIGVFLVITYKDIARIITGG